MNAPGIRSYRVYPGCPVILTVPAGYSEEWAAHMLAILRGEVRS